VDFPKDGTFGKSEAVFGPDLTNAPKFGFNLRPEPSGNELKLTPVIFVCVTTVLAVSRLSANAFGTASLIVGVEKKTSREPRLPGCAVAIATDPRTTHPVRPVMALRFKCG